MQQQNYNDKSRAYEQNHEVGIGGDDVLESSFVNYDVGGGPSTKL